MLLAERLVQKPSASVPNACRSWAGTAAAYRFLRNEEVSWDKVLTPHWQARQARMAQHQVILCIQGTIELNYNGQDIDGLGPLHYEAQRGLYLYPTYVLSPEREPLGVFSAWTWAREFKSLDGHRTGPCESIRWIESYERIAESAQKAHALVGVSITTLHACGKYERASHRLSNGPKKPS